MSWIQIWKKSKLQYSWKRVERACDHLTSNFNHDQPVMIVALARGGLIPATIMANKLCVRHVYSMGVSSYEQSADGKEHPNDFDVYQRLPVNTKIRDGSSVLLIDDISDRGSTFKYASDYIKNALNASVITMSLVVKPETKFMPDYYAQQVPQDQWVVFPWER